MDRQRLWELAGDFAVDFLLGLGESSTPWPEKDLEALPIRPDPPAWASREARDRPGTLRRVAQLLGHPTVVATLAAFRHDLTGPGRGQLGRGLRALADILASDTRSAVDLRAAWASALGPRVRPDRQVVAGTGLTGGGALTADVSLGLGTSGVTQGSYTNATVTVDPYGRVTSAASGSAGSTTDTIVQELFSGDIGGTWWIRSCCGVTGSAYSFSVLHQHRGPGAGTYEFEISARSVLPAGQAWRIDIYTRIDGGTATQQGSIHVAEGSRGNTGQFSIAEGAQIGVASISNGGMEDAVLQIKRVS